MPLSRTPLSRRRSFSTAALVAALALSGPLLTACSADQSASAQGTPAKSGASTALPTAIPAGTVIRIGDQNKLLQTLLSASGQDKDLPYKITYSAFQGGPAILEAFRAKALDVGAVAETPAIFAQAQQQDVKVFGVTQGSTSAIHIFTRPGSTAETIADLKGKKIAYTEGTTYQPALIQALKNAGLTLKDITPVKLDPLSIPAALGSGQVDAGVITEPLSTKYQVTFGPKGAHELTDDKNLTSGLQLLITPGSDLTDPAKEAALRDLSARFTRAELWLGSHTAAWVQAYYVRTEQLPAAVGTAVVRNAGAPTIPTYAAAIAAQQQVADLLVGAGALPGKLDVSQEFDTRFDAVQQQAAKDAG